MTDDERSRMTTSQLQDEQRAYYALCDRAAGLGIPTSLDDPASPATIAELEAAVAAAEEAQRADAEIGRCKHGALAAFCTATSCEKCV